ncbi:MAG: TIGR04255 family protein [Rhodobacteraceae bacterium]|nr:TIGR04255 family protein [Paracoccaceae bacterium]
MPFAPINDDHAIDAVSFSVFFAHPLPPGAINALVMNKAAWADDLPHERSDMLQTFQVGGGGPHLRQVEQTPAFEFSYLRPDGRPIWSLRTDVASITVLNTSYTRWEKIWPKSERLLKAALFAMATFNNTPNVIELAFEVKDSFLGDRDNYDISELLNLDAEEIARFCKRAGSTWHQHTGWFEYLEPEFQVLNQLFLDSVDAKGFKGEKSFVTIRHMQRLRPNVPKAIKEVASEEKFLLADQVNTLHGRNKSLLNKLLTQKMANRIGLED